MVVFWIYGATESTTCAHTHLFLFARYRGRWALLEALSGGGGPALGTSHSRGADPGARLPGCPGWVQETGTLGQEAPMP